MAMEAEVIPDRLKFGLAKMPMQEPLDPSIFFNVKFEVPLTNPRLNPYYIPGLLSSPVASPEDFAYSLSEYFRKELIQHICTGATSNYRERHKMVSRASEFEGHCLSLKYRYRPLIECRAIAYHILRNKYDVSLARVGFFFNVDHATVLNGLKSFNDWMEYVPEFRKKYERTAQHFSLDF